jgi:hypothetical protein
LRRFQTGNGPIADIGLLELLLGKRTVEPISLAGMTVKEVTSNAKTFTESRTRSFRRRCREVPLAALMGASSGFGGFLQCLGYDGEFAEDSPGLGHLGNLRTLLLDRNGAFLAAATVTRWIYVRPLTTLAALEQVHPTASSPDVAPGISERAKQVPREALLTKA